MRSAVGLCGTATSRRGRECGLRPPCIGVPVPLTRRAQEDAGSLAREREGVKVGGRSEGGELGGPVRRYDQQKRAGMWATAALYGGGLYFPCV